jgi:hypothetical protein
MNLDELNDALSASDPDPVSVYVQLDRKRRRSRQRMLAATSSMAVVLVAVVITGAVMRGIIKGIPSAGSSSSSAVAGAAPQAGSAVNGAASSSDRAPAAAAPQTSAVPGPKYAAGTGGQGAAGSCAGVPLKQEISAALRQGASVIVATGTLTGKSVTGSPATAGAADFYAMTLSSVQTLRGPAVATGSTAWIPGPAPGASASVTSALLAPGGRLFAIVWPQAATHDLVGPTLRVAPVVGQDVVFTPSGCWNVTALQPTQYRGDTSLKTVSGGTILGGQAHPAAEDGLYAVPLAKVEHVAAQA